MRERTFTLGPLPWSEETIEHRYWADFRGVWAAIREHPGFSPHRDILAVQQSLEILSDSVDELATRLQAFDTAAKTRAFWNRPARAHFDGHVRSVRRAMFAAATAAVAWRDLVRAVGTHCVDAGHPLSDWDVRWKAFTSLGEHQFVVGLRNCISHVGPVTPSWQMRVGFADPPTEATRFLLNAETLADCGELSVGARIYLQAVSGGVDLTVLFRAYMASIRSFHDSLLSSITQTFEPTLGEYRRYEAILARIRARVSWRLLLSIANPSNVDGFLAKELSPVELEEIKSFPAGSRVRADRIIEILDEEGASTPALRVLAYKALGAPDADAI